MPNKNRARFLVLAIFLTIFFPRTAKAVLPPDFIFNIGSQVIQFFSAIIIFCSGIFVFLYQFIKAKSAALRHQKTWIALGILVILALAGGASYFMAAQSQKVEYQKWLEESQANAQKEAAFQKQQTSTPPIPESLIFIPTSTPTQTHINFFETHKDTPLVISNDNFTSVLNTEPKNIFILDAREDIEFENGHFPNSNHIRFADIKADEWKTLPTDKFVYVFCWSGIRGKEVAEFLRTKGIIGIYLENGASGWYDFGGTWSGSIKFAEKYTDPKFQKVFTTEEVKKSVQAGVVLVDSREPTKFKRSHIKGAINIPMFFTPTKDLEKVFSQIPPDSKVITICDEFVNCFDAKVTGVELEKRQQQFLGRYNKPWDYGNE